jgi:hypothetical protein
MKGEVYIIHPDEMEFRIVLTAKLGSWKRLKEQLGTGNVFAMEMHRVINDCIIQAEKEFYSEPGGE